MNKAFENLGFINDSKISDDVVCKNLRNEMEDTFDNLNELVRSISKKQKYIYTDFKTDFDMILDINKLARSVYDAGNRNESTGFQSPG